MKKNLTLLLIGIVLFDIACTSNQKSQTEQSDTIPTIQTDIISTAQNDSLTEEKTIVQMLIEFYPIYNKIWEEADVSVLREQLDSLRQKYCTQRFRKEYIEAYADGHDVLICDFYSKDLKYLKITKDNIKESAYCVSYTIISEGSGNKKNIFDVRIQVIVVEEDGEFKIDEVLNPFSGMSLRE